LQERLEHVTGPDRELSEYALEIYLSDHKVYYPREYGPAIPLAILRALVAALIAQEESK
jgi:hypothetical protein